MAEPCARRSPCRNLLPTGKDEVAGATPTEGCSTLTLTLAVSFATIPYSAMTMARTYACNSPYQNPSSD